MIIIINNLRRDILEPTEILKTAGPYLTVLIDTWVKPTLKEKYEKKINTEKEVSELEHALKNYIETSYNKNIWMNTIVFRTQPKEIYELYVPLTIVGDQREIIVDNYPKRHLEELKKIAVIDSAGMGKSTLLKWMFINCIHHNIGIPMFIELRRLNKDNTLIDEITRELNSFNLNIPKKLMNDLIMQGDFVFFFDGYDEVPLESNKEVTTDLQNFISKAHKNTFVLSSRHQASIESFVDFYKFHIKPLSTEEAFDLIRKYDNNSELSKKLINVINQDNILNDLDEFLTNPLMISLLYKGFNHKQVIPLKKNLFYRQVYDALFEDHDLTKGGAFVHEKLSNLDSDNFHSVLRALAFISMKLGKIEYSKDELIQLLSRSQKQTKITFTGNLFLKDLISSVPLFYKDGDLYRWKHKSLQDYFAAQFICMDSKEHQKNILNDLYNNKNFDLFINVLDLSFDADFKTFRNTLILNFLREADQFSEYVESEMNLNKRDANLVKNLMFWKRNFIVTHDSLDDVREDRHNLHKFFDEISEHTNQQYKEEIKNYIPRRLSFGHKRNFLIYSSEKYNYKFIEILKRKNVSIFTEISRSQIEMWDDTLNEFFVTSDELQIELINFEILKRAQFYSDNNRMLNLLIDEIMMERTFFLDFDAITRMKEQIESDLEEEAELESFFSI